MKTFWFIVGSQFLYGEETLRQVEENAKTIAKGLKTKYPVVYKGTVKTYDEAMRLIKSANYEEECLGVITFCHTFSPSKMWANALKALQKPWCHFHTQFYDEIPNEEIDMDYMNLHQSAHGDREHGFIGTRLQKKRKVIVGHWQDPKTSVAISNWQDVVAAVNESKSLRVIRFGDNMREVAVTEGDKLEAQTKLGWQVNTIGVGALVEEIKAVTKAELNAKLAEYKKNYVLNTDNLASIEYQAKAEIAMKKILDENNAKAFTNTFEDLYHMEQLPGLATQNLMKMGYGYGGEGDWKTAAMTRIMKAIGKVATFMEDYTYDWKQGLILGAHMLEVCPSIAAAKPKIEVHHLGIGGKDAPARLVFEGKQGNAKAISLIDLGNRFRLIALDVECVKPTKSMPNLPVARVMWKPLPDLETSAACWLIAGGAHHTTLIYDLSLEFLRDFTNLLDIEFVHIGKDADPYVLEQMMKNNDIYYRLRG
ncbi:MAG: L-arabinose isomerase [Tenericutes bacterium ADurb.Bin239]|nr:MAG: L-arabinose isomerase [Tenericutes bacterium ADurb.Bin239]